MPCSSTPARMRCLAVLAAAVLEHHRLDARGAEELGEREPRRARTDDPDLGGLTISAGPLEQRRLALADPDAQRREAVAAAAPAQLVHQRHHQPRAAHPQRMAERDRSAVDVDALGVDSQLAHDGHALRRERLVQLDQVDVADRDAGALEQLSHRRDRPDAHHARINAGGGAAAEGGQRRRRRARRPAPRLRSRAPRRRRSCRSSCRRDRLRGWVAGDRFRGWEGLTFAEVNRNRRMSSPPGLPTRRWLRPAGSRSSTPTEARRRGARELGDGYPGARPLVSRT